MFQQNFIDSPCQNYFINNANVDIINVRWVDMLRLLTPHHDCLYGLVWSQSMFVLTNDEHIRLSWFQPEFFKIGG